VIAAVRQEADTDCLTACFGALLGLRLRDLPSIDPEARGRYEEWRRWLHRYGWDAVIVNVPPVSAGVPAGYWIASHHMSDGGVHAVVWYGDQPVWDPASGEVMQPGLESVAAGLVLVPLEPACCFIRSTPVGRGACR
jgi:hypothetical protein